MNFGYYKNDLYTHRYKLSYEKKKKSKESHYMVSHPETGSDSPIGSDRESGRDIGYPESAKKMREKEAEKSISWRAESFSCQFFIAEVIDFLYRP